MAKRNIIKEITLTTSFLVLKKRAQKLYGLVLNGAGGRSKHGSSVLGEA